MEQKRKEGEHGSVSPKNEVRMSNVEAPALVRARNAKWKTITIPLTPEQISELKTLGVETDQISILTFDIKRLGTVIPN